MYMQLLLLLLLTVDKDLHLLVFAAHWGVLAKAHCSTGCNNTTARTTLQLTIVGPTKWTCKETFQQQQWLPRKTDAALVSCN